MSDDIGLTCRPNIGPRERRRRMVLAGAAAGIAVVSLTALLLADAPRWWRLAVSAPIWAAVLCYLEARSRTCVVLAARGMRNLDSGNEIVDDADAVRASTAQSRTIYLWSTVVTGIAAAALMLVP